MQKTIVMTSGERYCLLVNNSGQPSFYPNLFITTQIRNRSLSFSAMESALGAISVLNRYFDDHKEDLQLRFLKEQFLEEAEIDAIRDYCQVNFHFQTTKLNSGSILKLESPRLKNNLVSSNTEYVRLTIIAQYLAWLADQIISTTKSHLHQSKIEKMSKAIRARRPIRRNRNSGLDEKGLSKDQIELMFELFRIDSNSNPFKIKLIRPRNRLVFLMLYYLGLRGGELLNIRIRDIDFSNNQIVIARRADEKSDPRKDQPLVKTMDRRLPIKDTLAKEIHRYIIEDRKLVTNSAKNDFLFITHKSGPTQGQPLSKSAYKKIISLIRKASPTLKNLTGHQLRHSWNETFSEQMDSIDDPPSEEMQEKIRSHLMGWREGSGTAAIYNTRFVKRKAYEASLDLQSGMVRLPKGIKSEN